MASSNLLLASNIALKALYAGQLAGTADVALYAAPSPGSALVKHGVACNTSGSTVLLTVRVIPSGGSVDATHIIISSYPVLAGDTLPLADYLANCALGPGDAIHAQAGTGGVLNLLITGVENT